MSEVARIEPAAAPAPTTDMAETFSILERAARDPNVSIEKMERIFDLMERAEKRKAETLFNAAMAKAQGEIEPVVRNKKNTHTGSEYADLFAITEAASSAISANGFGLTYSTGVATKPNCIRLICDVVHAGGHSKRYESDVPEDKAGSQGKVNKTDTQAFGSTLTYGRRYLMCLAFNIPITDKDGIRAHIASSPPITDAEVTELRTALVAVNADVEGFCRYMSVDRLSDLSASELPRAKAAIAKKARQAP